MSSPLSGGRRRFIQSGLATLFLPVPYAAVWAQSEGALKLLRLPKVALVIGNSAYKRAPSLKNPGNDARAMAEALRETGFEVTLRNDASADEMRAAFQAHARTLAARKCVGLFYFAGHGVQLAWRNYLLPVDAEIAKIDDIAAKCVDIGGLLETIAKSANPMNVIILDACRDNPFGGDVRLAQAGLSQMDAPPATLLAYATAPGNAASDGEGANGLYTSNLLREMKVRDAKIEDVFKRVRLGVRRASNGAQIPWESTSLEEDFYFQPPEQLRKLSLEEDERQFKEEFAEFERARVAKTSAVRRGVPAPLSQRAFRGARTAGARYPARRARREAGGDRLRPGQSQHRGHGAGRHALPDRGPVHLSHDQSHSRRRHDASASRP